MQPARIRRYYRFESYWEFESFDALLSQQLAAGKLIFVPAPAATEQPLPYQADGYYQVAGSQQIWALSTPDNAWRGYCLPLEEALLYQRQLNNNDRRRKGWLLLSLLTAAGYLSWLPLR